MLRSLASLRLTLVGIPLLAVAAFLHSRPERDALVPLLASLTLLSVNLFAALLVRRGFRRQVGLLVFHLALLAVLLLSIASTLTRFQGRFELVEGQRFDPASVTVVSRGPWHPGIVPPLMVTQGRIEVDFEDGITRRHTRSVLAVQQGSTRQDVLIGDTRGVDVDGYRWITSSNKGYALILDWRDANGTLRGAVHLPAFPLFEWKQENRWLSPNGQAMQLRLMVPPATGRNRWTLQSAGVEAVLVVEMPGVEPRSLRIGDSVVVGNGELHFADVRLWMGYRLEHDPVLPWMLLAALVGVAGLGGHFFRRYGFLPGRPCQSPAPILDTGVPGLEQHHG